MKWITQLFVWLKGMLGLIPAAPVFTKPALTYAQQVQLLCARGLVVTDTAKAEHCLEHHNYYRISAYRFPLSDPANSHQFLPGTTFEQLWGLYVFDGALRLLVMEAAKRVEISVRSRLAYEYGHTYGAHSYSDASHFRNAKKHAATLKKIDAEISRSKEDFILHFRQNHGLARPPIWAACEVMSFGNLSILYSIIGQDRDKKRLASTYGLSISDFGSLLHHIGYVRNLCAHHSRLWNRRFTITVELPKKKPTALIPNLNPGEKQRIYNTLVLLAHLMNIIQPGSGWATRVRQLIEAQAFPVASHMGFPADWQSRPIWQP